MARPGDAFLETINDYIIVGDAVYHGATSSRADGIPRPGDKQLGRRADWAGDLAATGERRAGRRASRGRACSPRRDVGV
jgi:hypothetical protein